MSLIRELKRRNVFRVAVAYGVVAWLALQVADVMIDNIGAPDWLFRMILLVLATGFPIALVLAWAFELTPEGFKRDSEVDRSRPEAPGASYKLNLLVTAALAAAVLFLLFERFRDPPSTDQPAITTVSQAPGASAPAAAAGGVDAADRRKAIAVLPFQNLSSNEENAFFAAGVHEDILTYLSRVADLRVNSRTSVQQYAERQLNLRDVAAELGARYIVEGSVRRADNRVRVTAQLIDASTDEHLWADNFDRELTDIFTIQTQVAEKIVAALEAELTPQEVAMLEDRPTESIEAYDLYLQARQNMQSIGLEAVQDYAEGVVFKLERAVAIDPAFSRAWALLALAHGESYWFLADRSPERLRRMKEAVDRARAVNSMLPEGLMAQALYHYRGFYEYEQALEALEQASELIPNDPLVHFNLGLTLRRLGRYDESIDAFLEAARLAPDGADFWGEALNTAVNSNRVERARAIVRKIPDAQRRVPRIVGEVARFHLLGEGDVQAARALLDRHPESNSWYELDARLLVTMAERRFEEAARIAVHPDYQEAIARGAGRVLAALAMELGGHEEEALALRKEAEIVLEEEVAKPYAETYAWPHLSLAKNQVRMGQPEAAIANCQRAMDILPTERDKVHGYELAEICAWVLAQSGRVDEALDLLERSRTHYNLGPWYLSLMPRWAFFQDNPRFQALAEQGEAAAR